MGKKKILPFATTGMDPEGIMLSEISQAEKDKYCMISLICGIEGSSLYSFSYWSYPPREYT